MTKPILIPLLCLVAAPAYAHHPLAGAPLETFTHGLLSGVGHPLLGFDHLFFVVLVGIAAVRSGHRLLAPLFYLGAMLGGCLLNALWATDLASESMIAVSLLVLGSMLLSGRAFAAYTVLVVFAAFGLFHGAAFGTTLAAQETGFGLAVLLGYLSGLAVTQYAIALAAGWVGAVYLDAIDSSAIRSRLVGALGAGAGLYLAFETIESLLLRAPIG